jgi:hypothetical protein
MSEQRPATFRVDARHWWRWGHAILLGWQRAGGCPVERRYPGSEDEEPESQLQMQSVAAAKGSRSNSSG